MIHTNTQNGVQKKFKKNRKTFHCWMLLHRLDLVYTTEMLYVWKLEDLFKLLESSYFTWSWLSFSLLFSSHFYGTLTLRCYSTLYTDKWIPPPRFVQKRKRKDLHMIMKKLIKGSKTLEGNVIATVYVDNTLSTTRLDQIGIVTSEIHSSSIAIHST